jgi:hypothetical protein
VLLHDSPTAQKRGNAHAIWGLSAAFMAQGDGEKSRSVLRKKLALCLIDGMIPETKRAQIIEALQANPNASAVARDYGVSKSAVGKIAKQANIDLAGRQQVLADRRALAGSSGAEKTAAR